MCIRDLHLKCELGVDSDDLKPSVCHKKEEEC